MLPCFQCPPVCLSLSVCVWCGRGASPPHSPGSWLLITCHLSAHRCCTAPSSRRQIVDSAVVVTHFRLPWCRDPQNYSSCLFPADYLLPSFLVPQDRFTSACPPACLPAIPAPLQPAILSSPLHLYSPSTPQ